MAHPCCCDDDILELPAQAADPAAIPGSGILYTKGANPDLYYENGVGDIIQLTDGDHINGAAVGGFTPDRIVYSDASGNLKVEAASATFGYDETTDTMTVRNIVGGGGGLPLTINTPALHSIGIGVEGTAYWNILATGSGYTAGTLAPNADTVNKFGAADLRLAQVFTGPGSAAAPSVVIAFAAATSDQGFYSSTTGTINLSTGGTQRANWNSTAYTVTVPIYATDGTSNTALGYTFSAETNTGFWRVGAGSMRFSGSGSTLLTLSTSSASFSQTIISVSDIRPSVDNTPNIGTASLRWGIGFFGPGSVTAPSVSMGFVSGTANDGFYTPAGGQIGLTLSGTERIRWTTANCTMSLNLLFSTDNTKDIGAAAATRPRTGYFATSVLSPVHSSESGTTTLQSVSGQSIRVDAQGAGTIIFRLSGTDRWQFNTSFHLAPVADNSYDIGDTTHRARTIYAGPGSAAAPSVSVANVSGTANDGLYSPGTGRLGITVGGTGRWEVAAAGHLLTINDNGYDIGATGATRPRTIYLGTSANIEADRGLILTNQTDAAGASVGTLTNAPASGDPVYWWKIKINGNNRAIPCWNG